MPRLKRVPEESEVVYSQRDLAEQELKDLYELYDWMKEEGVRSIGDLENKLAWTQKKLNEMS